MSAEAPRGVSVESRGAARWRPGRVGRTLWLAFKTRRGMLGACLALFVVAVAFMGPFVSRSPLALSGVPFAGPFGSHGLLGTDVLGRDVTARTLNGGWRLLLIAFAATALGVASGTAVGVTAAYRSGWYETGLMRSTDVLLAVPQLVFVLMIVSVIGPKAWLVVLATALAQAPQVARVSYAAAQDVCERDYVKVVGAWGVPPRTVIRRHVVPSLLTPLMVEFGLRLSGSIVLIAGLSLLGFGTQPPAPDWGVMINENRIGLASNPWGVIAPVVLLAMLAVGTNTYCDAVARVNIGDQTLRRTDANTESDDDPGDGS